MDRTSDVVVVGAGVVGCACAYYLALAGLKVTLLEQEAIASGSSTHATGFLLYTDFKDEARFRFGLESYRLTRDLVSRLRELTGIDVLYQRRPLLRVVMDDDEEELVRSALWWQGRLVTARWVDGDDVRRIEPRLSPAIRGAAYYEEVAQLDSARYTRALAAAAERLGAKVVLRRATGLVREGERVMGVRVGAGVMPAGAVVLAMGPWSALASEWLGFEVPVRPLRGERLMLRFNGPPLQVLVHSPRRGHLISRLDGFLSVGSTAGRDLDDRSRYLVGFSNDGFDVRPSPAALEELIRRAVELMPPLEEAEVVWHLAGVRPLSADDFPIIGPAPGAPGAYLATGHGTMGIRLAALTGRIIADLIAWGRCDLPLAFNLVDPGRFAKAGTRGVDESA
jgi:glycine/D-amino acid oxidase-like deaminating enzyme